MQKRIYKKITWITLLVFFVTLFNNITLLKVNGAVVSGATIAADDVVVLTGDLMADNNLGENWKPENYKGKLKEYKNGIYEATFKIKANTKPYSYKIALNGTWDVNYGKDSVKGATDNIALNVTADQDVTFRFDYKNQKVYDSINNPEQFKTKAILTGEVDKVFAGGKNWDVTDNNFALDYVGGGIYSKTFDVTTATTMNYKVSYNGAWSNGEVTDNVVVKIPEGTKQVTFYADYINNKVYDSINNPELLNVASLIGTVRAGGDAVDWKIENTDFEMYKIDATKVMYTGIVKAGTYEYKTALNHAWTVSIPATGNVNLKLAADTNVVFIADLKTNTIIDSVNNASEVAIALGLKAAVVEVKSPVINGNGTITFNYKAPEASSVYFTGNINGWSTNNTPMIKNADGVWSTTIRVGDKAQDVQYKFIVDGKYVTDPTNTNVIGENSSVSFPEYKGRPVTIPGSLSTAIPGTTGTWNPADEALILEYIGNGNYKKTFKNVKAGKYDYKVALNKTWDPENYGAKGVDHGANISIVIPREMDLTFYYNDDSHKIVNSLNYKVLDVTLNNGTTKVGKLTDAKLNGVYTLSTDLKAGTYDNLSLAVSGETNKEIKLDKFTVATDRTVTFSFDPLTEICFNDASDSKIDVNGVYFNSRLEEYKSPYGASPVGTEITFNTSVKKDINASQVKMVLGTTTGTQVIDMTKSGTFSDGSDKWTTSYTPTVIGNYTYYFVISNGSDVKAYGDDDGFFGAGKAANLGEVSNYEFNVCTKDFKTPDWLKNGVVYQIYPDRFFNGDTSNDYVQKYARGTIKYEFPTDWYSIPKSPDLFKKEGFVYPDSMANGEPINKGDMTSYSNDLYGGDLKGIEDKVGYLKSLGVTVLYMNPVGQSISSHRYDTTDYTKVDPQLGTMDDFVNLAKTAKANGMHIILDGVYNHVSDDSVYFDRYGKYIAAGKPLGAYQYWKTVYDDMNTNGVDQATAEAKAVEYYKSIGITDLHYKDWFKVSIVKPAIKDAKGNDVKDANGNVVRAENYGYEGWNGYDSMPVIQALNGSEYQVKTWANDVIDGPNAVSREWLQNGSNGWRLDVANEVSDETWRAFRTAVKSEGDNAIVGEIWTDASSYILGDMYDSVMNYRFRGAVVGFVKGSMPDDSANTAYSAKNATNELEKMREQYPREALEAMMNLVDSHDTQRVISALDGYGKGGPNRGFANEPTELAKQKMRLIPFIQMTYNGAPTIYYGDEEGLAGCDDPDNRRGFEWGKGDQDLVEWYASLAAIRSNYSALRTGDVAVSEVQSTYADDVMAYVRSDAESKILVAANRQQNEITTTLTTPGIADGTKLTNLLNTAETYTVKDGKVTVKISALGGVILADKVKEISVNKAGLSDAYSESAVVADRTAPVADDVIIKNIQDAKEGSEIVISNINEGISKNVLQALVDSNKNLKAVITRGNIKVTISDPKAILAKMKEQGLTDFQFVLNDGSIANEDAIKDITSNVVKKLNIKTNLLNGELGTEMTFEIPVDKENNGSTLYFYTVDSNGDRVLKGSAVVSDGILKVSTDRLGDSIITNTVVTGNANGTETPVSNGTITNDVITSDKLNSKKTSDPFNNSTVALFVMMFMLSAGTVVVVTTNRRKKAIK